ncbi:hypothetical protein Vretimale_18414 [Volvox reticuliferus]|uniref:Uncharacterized protein n=1 Tax=Volvox reticuliferus TaxID=1737510 RepID=A0A8J4GUU6_9CHLO|nr:hypothetical protein Vretimale_18414 [Volvox reticuliferus]
MGCCDLGCSLAPGAWLDARPPLGVPNMLTCIRRPVPLYGSDRVPPAWNPPLVRPTLPSTLPYLLGPPVTASRVASATSGTPSSPALVSPSSALSSACRCASGSPSSEPSSVNSAVLDPARNAAYTTDASVTTMPRASVPPGG